MKNNAKFKIIILTITVLLLFSLCACTDPTNQTHSMEISLPVNGNRPLGMGDEFSIVKEVSSGSACYYEILPNQFDEFVTFLESRDYYRGKIILYNTAILPSLGKTNVFKAQDECLWFSYKGSVWVGKKYTNKFFYIAQVEEVIIVGDNFRSQLSSFLLTSLNYKIEAGEEYPTSLSWEDIKAVYNGNVIDEENQSIRLDSSIYDNEEYPYLSEAGFTTLVYNQENSTIKILNEYTKK
ncbi:MAG: hypothetical protein HDT29_00400 [Clostridiales bacterium]|nr:hypothetical protein [Clostridiales bacterium]